MEDHKYVVKKGDSLWKIANDILEYPYAWPLLVKYNEDKITNPNLIFPGQIINVPPQWFKPKITEPHPIKVNLTINNQPKEEEEINISGGFEVKLPKPLVVDTPYYKYTVGYSGKLLLTPRQAHPSNIEITNAGVTASIEQKMNTDAGEILRKFEVKMDKKDLYLRSTMTVASFGPNTIKVSPAVEMTKNGHLVCIYEINFPTELKGNFRGHSFVAKDFKYSIEVEFKSPPDSDDNSEKSNWTPVYIVIGAGVAVVFFVGLLVYAGIVALSVLFETIFTLSTVGSITYSSYAPGKTLDGNPMLIKRYRRVSIEDVKIRSVL